MDNREIATELAVACLSHEVVGAMFRPARADKGSSVAAGERVGGLYNAIWKALQEELVKSAKPPQVQQF